MARYLLAFGDSWTYGAELEPSMREFECYAGHLGRMLPADHVLNFSEVGSGLANLHLQLDRALASLRLKITNRAHQFVAVFFLSGRERFMLFDENGEFAHLTAPGVIIRPGQRERREHFESIYRFYYRNIHSDQADLLSVNTNLLALQARCRYHQFEDYYISGWEKLDIWPEIDKTKIYGSGQQTCADILGIRQDQLGELHVSGNRYIVPKGSHPTPEGHALIAQTLNDMIRSRQAQDLGEA